jgi:hypothetical protein
MRRLVCISTGVHFNPYSGVDANNELKMCSELDVDGVELLIGEARELLKFRLNKKYAKSLRDLKFNTIHVPFVLNGKNLFFSDNNISKQILKRLYFLYDKLNAANINIHPQQIKCFKILDMKNYQHSIENMEMHYGFKIRQYRKFLDKGFKFVLDTSHASEAGELDKLFKAFKKDIIYTHLSANYFNHLHVPLHALKEEYLKPLQIIKKGKFPIVLESQIGAKDIKEYEKEVNFARKWLSL